MTYVCIALGILLVCIAVWLIDRKAPSPSGKTPAYAYMESMHASSASPWHIRRIPKGQGLKLGGGITTPSLCGKVRDGWDLRSRLDQQYDPHTCPWCIQEYHRALREDVLNHQF